MAGCQRCQALIQCWDAALPNAIVTARHSCAIAPEQHCVVLPCSDLFVSEALIQCWDAALPNAIVTARYSCAIAPEFSLVWNLPF